MSELNLKTGDVITLNHYLTQQGLSPEHLALPDHAFTKIYGCTKTQWFIDHEVPAFVFLRKTTKSGGHARSLIAGSGRFSQQAVANHEICAFPGSWAVVQTGPRWVPVMPPEEFALPDKAAPLKPIINSTREWVTFHDGTDFQRLPIRWNSNLAFLNPDIKTFTDPCLVVIPGTKNSNLALNGGSGKSHQPKLGVGIMVSHQVTQLEPTHDNQFAQHMSFQAENIERWITPINNAQLRYIYGEAGVPKGAMAINWPITGIGKIYPALQPRAQGFMDLSTPEALLTK